MSRQRHHLHTAFLCLLLTAAEATAQVVSTAPAAPAGDMGSSLFQLFLGLAGIIGLLVGSLWLLKKMVVQRGESAGLMRVVAGTAVGTRERVVIVEVGSTWLVLGVAPGRVSPLAEIPRQAIPAAATAASGKGPSFPEWLRQIMQKK